MSTIAIDLLTKYRNDGQQSGDRVVLDSLEYLEVAIAAEESGEVFPDPEEVRIGDLERLSDMDGES